MINKIPNQIITAKLQPLNLSGVTKIALHHMATDVGVKKIEEIHVLNNGWIAIGYNYWVGFDGTVYEGRGLNLGAGVDKQNSGIISIGFQGDYHSKAKSMSDAQFNAGIDVIQYVKSKVPAIKTIGGHKDFMATACPGQYFPLAEMIAGRKREKEEEKIMIYNYIDKNMPDWAREPVQWAVDNGVIMGTETGLNLDDKDLRYIVWLYRAKMVK